MNLVVSIDDIGIIPYDKDDEHHANTIEGDIIGVLSSEEYLSCLNCKDKVSHINETIAKRNACDSIVTPCAHARARGYVIGRGVYIYIVYKSALFFGTNFLSPKILTFRGLL